MLFSLHLAGIAHIAHITRIQRCCFEVLCFVILTTYRTVTICSDRLYVIKREYYVDENCKRKVNKHYLGQVVNNRFYTSQEYKEKFSKGVRMKRKALAGKNRQHAITEEIS